MTTSVQELVGELEAHLGIGKAAGWDPVGLQIGDPSAPAEKVAVCHEVTTAVVDRLVTQRIDLAVTYHPLLFHPVDRLVVGPGPSGRAHRLIANGISLLVVHTAFDVIAGGVADALAETLGLAEAKGFGPLWGVDTVKIITFVPPRSVDKVASAMSAAGAGHIGRYTNCSYRSDGVGTFLPQAGAEPAVGEVGVTHQEPETRLEMICPSSITERVVAALVTAHPYEEPAYDVIATKSNAGFLGRIGRPTSAATVGDVANLVSDRLGGSLRIAGSGPVAKVAVIPGSGGSLLPVVDADVVVTGDVSHHQARSAMAAGNAVIDPGHAATERPGVKALYAAVATMVEHPIDLTDVDSDPWEER